MKYIALEETNFDWDYEEVEQFDYLWSKGYSIYQLTKIFKRTQIEIAIIVIDRNKKGFIKRRENGLFGGWER